MILLTTCVLLFGTTCVLTGIVRAQMVKRQIMDLPNERSSHSLPTPRGGGLAIVAMFSCAMFVAVALGKLSGSAGVAFVGSGLLIAVVGFIDDRKHVAARWRLLAQFVAVGWLLYWLPGRPVMVFDNIALEFGPVAYAVVAVGLVWLINLYNFMDGINGIAGVEAISSCAGAALICLLFGYESLALTPLFLAVTAAGFLCWNFPRARIFLGDSGSAFLGLIIGGMMMEALIRAPGIACSWFILMGVFITDASLTLLRRLVRGERIYEAHRSHAYQNAAARAGSHVPVTFAVLIINVCWLFPWAWAVAAEQVAVPLALACAYLPLLAIAWKFGAGLAFDPQRQSAGMGE